MENTNTTQHLQSDFIDFFGYQIEITPQGDWGKVRIGGIECIESFAEKLREIYVAFEGKKEQLKLTRKLLKEKSKNFEKALQARTQRKHRYQRAIAAHLETSNHYKRQIRAFEQLAKANEESKKELERNRRTSFSIGEE